MFVASRIHFATIKSSRLEICLSFSIESLLREKGCQSALKWISLMFYSLVRWTLFIELTFETRHVNHKQVDALDEALVGCDKPHSRKGENQCVCLRDTISWR